MTIEGHSVVFWLRRLLAPLISAGAGLAISYFGLPPDVVASSPGPPVRQLGQFSRLSGHVRQSMTRPARPGAQPRPPGHEAHNGAGRNGMGESTDVYA